MTSRETNERRHDRMWDRTMSLGTWTRNELASLCEAIGVAKSGPKAHLIHRILIAEGLAA